MMIRFNKEEHLYYLEDKTTVPSVTQIIKNAGLINYSNVPDYILKRAATRGTAVHEACELFDKKIDKFTTYLSIPLLEPYIKAWISFVRQFSPDFMEIESIVYSEKHNFAGTLDRVCMMDNVLWIIDIKTGAEKDYHRLQTAGYSIAFKKYDCVEIFRACVYLSKDGGFQLNCHLNDDDINEFLDLTNQFKLGVKNNAQ